MPEYKIEGYSNNSKNYQIKTSFRIKDSSNIRTQSPSKPQNQEKEYPFKFQVQETPKYVPKPIQKKENPLTALNLLPILGFSKTVQVWNDVKNKAKDKVKQEVAKSEMLQDILGVLRENGEFRSIKDMVNMGMNGVKRKFGIGIEENKSKRNTNLIKAFNAPTELPDTTVLNVAQSKASYNINNDTIKFFEGYSLPTSINLKGVKLGARNRGDVAPIKSSEIIPMYRPIISYEQGIKEGKFREKDSEGLINEFLGFDKNGNIKIGTLDKFGPGDTMTQVFYGWINSIPRDNNGNLMFERYSKSRDHRKSPVVDMRGETKDTTKLGNSYRGSLLLSTGNQRTNFNADLFGDVAGGAYILQVDNEFRFVRGSVNNVIDEIEKMQKNHKGKPIKFYEVDNGSYSRGLRSFNNVLTSEQQKAYDSQNWYAGHFFYITPESYPIKVLDNKKDKLKTLREGFNNRETQYENNIRNSTLEKYSR